MGRRPLSEPRRQSPCLPYRQMASEFLDDSDKVGKSPSSTANRSEQARQSRLTAKRCTSQGAPASRRAHRCALSRCAATPP
jgi:hypothetical protein